MSTDSQTSNNYYAILKQAFDESQYLHSAGSGDVQSLQIVVDTVDHMWDVEELQPKTLVIAGAIAASAMISVQDALQFAAMIVDGDTFCENCLNVAVEDETLCDACLYDVMNS
jgi:hypothetical protein